MVESSVRTRVTRCPAPADESHWAGGGSRWEQAGLRPTAACRAPAGGVGLAAPPHRTVCAGGGASGGTRAESEGSPKNCAREQQVGQQVPTLPPAPGGLLAAAQVLESAPNGSGRQEH